MMENSMIRCLGVYAPIPTATINEDMGDAQIDSSTGRVTKFIGGEGEELIKPHTCQTTTVYVGQG